MIELSLLDPSGNTYVNIGDITNNLLINDVWNNIEENPIIDLRLTNVNNRYLVNLGEMVDADLLTDTYNNSL